MVVETMQVVDERKGQDWRVAALPDRIRKTIIGRLERLTEGAQRLAAAAAVIGREFEFPSSSARPVWGNGGRRRRRRSLSVEGC